MGGEGQLRTDGEGARVLTVDAGTPFLPTLAAALLSGAFSPDGRAPEDPLALAAATVYLPTRRAARGLADVLLEASPFSTAILPRIRALGDLEAGPDGPDPDGAGDLPPPADGARPLTAMEARAAMAGLVERWDRLVHRDRLELLPGRKVRVPQSPADAVRLAADLLALVEAVETEELDWSRLDRLAPEGLARYWQITLDFLAIAVRAWPEHLHGIGALSPALHRRRLIDGEAARLCRLAPDAPVVVAGSTGSVPATARLMRAVLTLPAGAVVLPGLDRHLDGEAWAALLDPERPAAEHPQHGLARLLQRLGVPRERVVRLGPAPPAPLAARAVALSAAMRPAATTHLWRADRACLQAADMDAAFAGVSLVEAADEREEALAVAVGLREAVAEGRAAALVTPDRQLARRVARELARWGIEADDSGGLPLSATPAGVLARLVAETATGSRAATVLALLKHPLARFGLDTPVRSAGIAAIEHRLFRRMRIAGGPDALLAAARRAAPADGENRALPLAEALADALAPLAAFDGRKAPPAALAKAHGRALVAVLGSEAAWRELAATPDGRALAGAFEAIAAAPDTGFVVSLADWPATFEALAGDGVVRPEASPWLPRVAILGPLEARLQSVDRLFVGGLVEGVAPRAVEGSPWMSRGMMQSFGLDSPERRVGLQAHDFTSAMGAREVVLSRPKRRGDAPAVASRWLQRLDADLGPAAMDAVRARGARLQALARRLDRPAGPPRPAPRPAPTPPLAARPRELSVTDVGRLVRDPYAVYASRVLGLQPLDPLDPVPDAADRGRLIHRILAGFAAGDGPIAGEAGVARFLAIAEDCLAAHADAPAFLALWRPRMEAIARAVVAFEAERADVVARHAEIAGRMTVGTPAGPVDVVCRADRVDVLGAGGLEVIDFKTGSPPSRNQVDAHLEPQLPLEGLVIARGGFAEIDPQSPVERLTYVAVKGGEPPLAVRAAGKTAPADLVWEVAVRLDGLLARYADPATGYLSRARLAFARRFDQPYDHLARAQEWADTGFAEDGDG